MTDEATQLQLLEINNWTDDQIRQAALNAGADSSSRILGIYFEVGPGFQLPNLVSPGFEYVRFVGIDTQTGERVVANYIGATASFGINVVGGTNVGLGTFSYSGTPRSFSGIAFSAQLSAGSTSGGGINFDGDVLSFQGGNTSVGVAFGAGYTLSVSVNGEFIYKNFAHSFQSTFSGFEFDDAFEVLNHPDFQAGDFVDVQVKLEEQGVIVTHRYQKVVDSGNGVVVNYSATVTDLDGNPVSDDEAKQYVDQGIEKYTLGRNDFCFAAGTPIEMADGTTKPIEEIKLGDMVAAFDGDADRGRGAKAGRRVTQLQVNHNQVLFNFHGTRVTPGHVYLTGAGEFKPIIEILEEDGTVVNSDGVEIRARTGWPVGSPEDRAIPVGYPDQAAGKIEICMMRAGTLYGGKEGRLYTIQQMMESRGYHLMADGRFVNVEGDIKTALWDWGIPDDKMMAGKRASYADLVEGAEIGIGMPLVPSRPN